jgi:hypothetical protein
MAFENPNSDVDPTDRKAAPSFNLFELPFYLLRVEPTATNLEINSAFASARDGGRRPEDALLSARDAILSPATRLSCELSYPLDSRPNEIDVLYAALSSAASTNELLLIADQLAPLSSAHFCAHLAASRPADSAILYAIIVSYGAIDSTEIYDTLRAFRTAARWPTPSLLSVNNGLREMFDLHAEAALGRYDSIEDASEPLLACAQAILASGEWFHIEVLEEFLATYGKLVETKRTRVATLIENAVEGLRQQPEEARLAVVLANTLPFWDVLCGPLWLLSAQQDRQDEDLSRPADQVSCLVDDLIEQRHYSVARQIAEAGRELPGLVGKAFDIRLRRIEHLASGGPLKGLRNLTAQLDADASSLVKPLEHIGFGPHAPEPIKRLWEAFAEAAHSCDEDDATEPWTLLRDLAVRLSRNEHHTAASALIRGMIQHGQAIVAPPEIQVMLPYDLSLIEGQRQARSSETGSPKTPVPAEPAVQPPEQPMPVAGKPDRTRRGVLKAFRLAGGALAGAAIFFGFGEVPALRWQQVSGPPLLQGAIALEEEIPAVGTGQRYSLPYVRYCHFQQERLKVIKELAQSPEDVRAYNLLVVDYNSRCSDFLYQSQDLVTVVAEVTANKSRIESDAKRIVSTWPGR